MQRSAGLKKTLGTHRLGHESSARCSARRANRGPEQSPALMSPTAPEWAEPWRTTGECQTFPRSPWKPRPSTERDERARADPLRIADVEALHPTCAGRFAEGWSGAGDDAELGMTARGA